MEFLDEFVTGRWLISLPLGRGQKFLCKLVEGFGVVSEVRNVKQVFRGRQIRVLLVDGCVQTCALRPKRFQMGLMYSFTAFDRLKWWP